QELAGVASTVANPVAAKLAGLAIRGMFLTQIRTRIIGVALALLLAGGGLGAWQALVYRAAPRDPAPGPAPADATPVSREDAPVVREKMAGPETLVPIDGPTTFIRGKVLDGVGHPLPFATVTALMRRPFRPGQHGLRDEVVAQGKADEQGTFRLRVPA